MSHLEPSYLRYIYDGLEKGNLHPDNTAALPEGLTGLYEDAFEENVPARDRQKLLSTFAIWALLKKEVSAQFVAEILNVHTQEIIDFIATYSSWFTSPESGKYQLYHERLKVYLLQKLSEQEIATLQDKLVSKLEHALSEKKEDEFEIYGLEYLSVYYLTTAMLTGDGKNLISLSYDQNHWQRQQKLSKGFEWTKKGLKQVMNWASKFNDEEVIECGLQMVDLHHQEQNDAPQIVVLVADGDVDTALKRIEAFGGNNKDGLQRKFILYMLCLIELTLLDSKDKPFSKEVIEKLLKHLDDNLPIDHSILNWSEFMPDSLMRGIIHFLLIHNIDHISIIKRSKLKIDLENIENYSETKKSFICDYKYRNEIIFSSLENSDSDITIKEKDYSQKGIEEKARNFFEIVLNHLSKDEFEEANFLINKALFYSSRIPSDDMWGSYGNHLVGNFAEEVVAIGFHKLAIQMCKKMEKGEEWTDSAFRHISKKLLEKRDAEKLQMLYSLSKKESYSNTVFKCLADCHYLQGKPFEIKEKLINHLNYNRKLIDGFKNLSFFNKLIYLNPNLKIFKLLLESEINKINSEGDRFIESIIDSFSSEHGLESLGNDLISVIDLISRQELKSSIVTEYTRNIIKLSKGIGYVLQNGSIREDFQIESYYQDILYIICEFVQLDEAIGLISEIDDQGTCRYDAAKGILRAYIASKQDLELKQSIKYHDIIKKIILTCNDEKSKDRMLYELLKILQDYSLINEVRYFIDLIKDNKVRYDLLILILKKQENQTNLNESKTIIMEILQCARLIIEESKRCTALKEISNKMNKLGNFDGASSVLQEALESALQIKDESKRISSLLEISEELLEQGHNLKAAAVINDSLELAKNIQDQSVKNSTLNHISNKLIKQGKIYEALECSKLLTSEKYICWVIGEISEELAKLGKFDEAFNCLSEINDPNELSRMLKKISDEFIKRDKINEAFECVRGIGNEYWKSSALMSISIELEKKGLVEEAKSVMLEALEYARITNDDYEKGKALFSISNEFVNQGKFIEAIESIIGINDVRKTNDSIKKILNSLLEEYGITQCEIIGNKISNSSLRNIFFKELSKFLITNCKNDNFLIQFEKLELFEAKKWYLRNWVDNIEIIKLDKKVTKSLIYLCKDQTEIIETLLQYFVLNNMFFENLPEEKIQRYNRILNIQWAIDIKNQLYN
jgi:hypothetical protein